MLTLSAETKALLQSYEADLRTLNQQLSKVEQLIAQGMEKEELSYMKLHIRYMKEHIQNQRRCCLSML